jgi:16S rRNA processing protein RimM
VELGRIVNRHGIRGELRCLSHNPDSTALVRLDSVQLVYPDESSKMFHVVAARPHKQFVLLQLEGVTTVDDADTLVGCRVAAPRAVLPPAGPSAAYHIDLVGCAVRTTGGALLGTVCELIVTGSNDVCVVRGTGREYLIPMIADVIVLLDTTERTIVVHPLPGLLDP